MVYLKYRKISNIRCTESQNLNDANHKITFKRCITEMISTFQWGQFVIQRLFNSLPPDVAIGDIPLMTFWGEMHEICSQMC